MRTEWRDRARGRRQHSRILDLSCEPGSSRGRGPGAYQPGGSGRGDAGPRWCARLGGRPFLGGGSGRRCDPGGGGGGRNRAGVPAAGVDVMEDAEVVVYQEQEQVSSEEQGQEHPRPGTPSDRPALEALVALQLELDPVNKKAQRAHARLKHKNCQRRRVHLEHRSAIIQGIPGFWVEVVSLGVVLVNFFFFNWATAGAVYRSGSSGTKFTFLDDVYWLPSCISVPESRCDVLAFLLAQTDTWAFFAEVSIRLVISTRDSSRKRLVWNPVLLRKAE